ncbi:MAG: hypothetical protein FWF12_10975 [Betaproteobacteria bacterium]|nr:hypothetical protein [Betaproteobacteria bacterium]
MFNTKKPIKEFGKLYEYLKDHDLREKEQGTGHLDVRDADFSGATFENGFIGIWKNFIFTNCLFPASAAFQLKETTGCIFNMCEFGPGRKDVTMDFGTMKNCRFQKCKFTNGNVTFGRGEAIFTNCEFENTTSSEYSWNYFIGGDTLLLDKCKLRFYNIIGEIKLHMRHSDYMSRGAGPMGSGRKQYTADFIFEDTRLENAEKILWNEKINNLTLRGCQVEGKFSTQQASIKESIVLEKLKVGTYHIARTGTEKKITVRDCFFSEVEKERNSLFSCSGGYAAEVLIERVECSNAAPCNLTGATHETTESFRRPTPRNQTFTLRGCKIPHLMVHWLMSYNLIIEDCEFGKLEMPNGRFGNVTIKNTKFDSLDLTNTLAGKFDIQPSGKIVTAGSNYPQGGYKIDGVK